VKILHLWDYVLHRKSIQLPAYLCLIKIRLVWFFKEQHQHKRFHNLFRHLFFVIFLFSMSDVYRIRNTFLKTLYIIFFMVKFCFSFTHKHRSEPSKTCVFRLSNQENFFISFLVILIFSILLLFYFFIVILCDFATEISNFHLH
jgi:hypothetical protein